MHSVVSVHIVLIRILNKNNKTTKRTVLNGEAKHITENIITHNSKVKTGCLSMVLNQGQRLTAASD